MGTTANLLRHFEAVHHELQLVLGVLDAAQGEAAADIRHLRQRATAMREDAQKLIDWLGAARLEAEIN